ncbi:unnamed protein product, partial [Ceratitis capitata]
FNRLTVKRVIASSQIGCSVCQYLFLTSLMASSAAIVVAFFINSFCCRISNTCRLNKIRRIEA